MGRIFFEGEMTAKPFEGGQKGNRFDGKKTARLGTEKNPAMVNVQTEERREEITSLFEAQGWKYSVAVEPDKPEDISELEILLHPPQPKVAEKKVGRNEPCPCGSGNKYKKCCGQ
jgi:SWIM/SEC-C metal-binding protein